MLIAAGIGVLTWMLFTGVSTGVKDAMKDFQCFHEGAVAALRGEDIYLAGRKGYIYPPMMAFLLQPLGAMTRSAASIAWAVVLAPLVVLTGWLSAKVAADRFGLALTKSQVWAAASLAGVVLADKFNRELKEGNCNVLIILGVVLAVRWLGKRPVGAGLALAFAINIKYLPIVYVPYLIVRRRLVVLVALAAGVVGFALMSALRFGWAENLRYIGVALRGMNQMAGGGAEGAGANIHPLAWEASISIPSVLARYLPRANLSESFVWPIAGGIAVLAGVAAILMYRRQRVPLFLDRAAKHDNTPGAARALTVVEWGGLLVGALLFSPQTVARHVNMALPLVAVAAVLLLHGRAGTRNVLMIALSVLLLGLYWPPGVDALQPAVKFWRSIGGISWCLLASSLLILWAGTKEAALVPTRGVRA